MRGPYTYSLHHDDDVLDTDAPTGILETVRGFAMLRAHEWIAAGIVDTIDCEICDASGEIVRSYVIYKATKGRHVGHIVMQRV